MSAAPPQEATQASAWFPADSGMLITDSLGVWDGGERGEDDACATCP